jgi:hypothetical protein
MGPVTFAYDVDGQQFTKPVDMALTIASSYDEQTRVPVVYDPHNPMVCHILSYYARVKQE